MGNINGSNRTASPRNGVARKATSSTDRQRPVLAATVPAALKHRVEREMQRRGSPTLSAVVEALLEEALSASDEGRRGDVTATNVQRLNLRLATLESELRSRDALLIELITTLTRTFLAHTPPPADHERERAKQSATERFERLMKGVMERVERGESHSQAAALLTPVLIEGGSATNP